jgi:hypothetical protein
VVVAAATFAINHRHSFRTHIEADAHGTPNIGTLKFLAYIRVAPMHLVISFRGIVAGDAGYSAWTILLFGALKAAADVAMHIVEHRILQRAATNRPKL